MAWLCLALVAVGASCSVFPDEATLPLRSSAAGAAGASEPSASGANAGGGQGTDVTPEGGVGGELLAGGAAGAAAGGSELVVGGAAGQSSGAGGEGGSPVVCQNPRTVRAKDDADTWIDSANPNNNRSSDKQLFVTAGANEDRLLLSLSLPPTPAGAVLRQATLHFHLESNADAGLTQRRLGVHRLLQPLDEGRATWLNWGKNKDKWDLPGGDFGVELARLTIPAGTASGNVDFDVTDPVSKLQGAAAIPLSLIVLESSQARPAPAELAFTSREGNASQVPELLLEYCDP